jgi:hypothetical protein
MGKKERLQEQQQVCKTIFAKELIIFFSLSKGTAFRFT